MKLVPPDTRSDWERVRAAFEVLRTEQNILANDTPLRGKKRPDHPDRRRLRQEAVRKKMIGYVIFFDEDVDRARRDGELRFFVAATPKTTIGSWLVDKLFSENVAYALTLVEKEAVAEVVEDALDAQGLKVAMRVKAYQRVTVSGEWNEDVGNESIG